MAYTVMNEKQVAQVMIQTLMQFREKIDPEMQVQQLLTYLIAVRSPGTTMQDVMKELDLSSASISRNVAALGRINRFHQPGHDLLSAYEDPMERRRKVVDLTAHGTQFAKWIAEVFNKGVQVALKRGD